LLNFDRVRWLIVSGWYMEKKEHLDSPYGVWSKIEGKRSKLESWQLTLLTSWNCEQNSNLVMETMSKMIPEILRLNKQLSMLVNTEEKEDLIKRTIEMVY